MAFSDWISSGLWLTMAAQFIIALLHLAIFIGKNTFVMSHTEQAYNGRVTGINTPLMTGSMLLMMSLPCLKDALSLTNVYELAGLCFLAGLLIIVSVPKFRLTIQYPNVRIIINPNYIIHIFRIYGDGGGVNA